MLPRGTLMYLTNKCNLDCIHCGIVAKGKESEFTLDYEVIKKVLDDFKNNKVYIVAYSGGDPILHEKFFDILEETRKRNMLSVIGC